MTTFAVAGAHAARRPRPLRHRYSVSQRVRPDPLARGRGAQAAASGFDTSSRDLPSAAVPQIPPTTAAISISAAPMP